MFKISYVFQIQDFDYDGLLFTIELLLKSHRDRKCILVTFVVNSLPKQVI